LAANAKQNFAEENWPQNRIKNDKRDEGRIGIEGSGRTIIEKKCFPQAHYALLIKIQRS
jgi:hypothetical protein